jgi:hypothetical protein
LLHFRFKGLVAASVADVPGTEAAMCRVNKAKGKHCFIYSKVWYEPMRRDHTVKNKRGLEENGRNKISLTFYLSSQLKF